jgi:HSP20 family molecular chaperone IbpA
MEGRRMRPDERIANERHGDRGRHVVRDAGLGDAPERPAIPTRRPRHELTLAERLRQERAIRLDSYDVAHETDCVRITADLAGVEPSEVSLSIDPGVITIACELRENAPGPDHDPLWWTCRDSRPPTTIETIALPPGLDVDGWTATFDAGVLTVTIPRRD